MHDFVSSLVGHLGNIRNISSLSYVDLPNADRFHYIILKFTFINITAVLIRKVFTYWETVKLMVADTSFPIF